MAKVGAVPTADQFRAELNRCFAQAERTGQTHINIKSGDLHRELGGYPLRNHRMPVCCYVMRAAMCAGDKIISGPPSGKGATLVIRYRLPR